MKPIVLHTGSVVVGVVLACAGLFAASAQAPVVESVLHPTPRRVDVHVAGIPDPRDAVLLREQDGAYTVPPGNRLVLTGLGTVSSSGLVTLLRIDGLETAYCGPTFAGGMLGTTFASLPSPGIVVEPGSVVTLFTGNNPILGRAIGYLIDE